MYKYIHTCIYIYIYTCPHTYTHTHIYTHTYEMYIWTHAKHVWNDGAAAREAQLDAKKLCPSPCPLQSGGGYPSWPAAQSPVHEERRISAEQPQPTAAHRTITTARRPDHICLSAQVRSRSTQFIVHAISQLGRGPPKRCHFSAILAGFFCISVVIGLLTVWWHNKPKTKRNPPRGRGVSYLLCSLIKNWEEEDPRGPLKNHQQNRSILGVVLQGWFFKGGPLPPSSWLGNIINRKPPGGFLSVRLLWPNTTWSNKQPICSDGIVTDFDCWVD